MSRIDHIGIATEDIEQASKFWKLIGMKPGDDEINLEQDVKIRMFYGNNENGENTHSKVELIEALSENSPIAKFISKRGEGIQQLAIAVVDIDELIKNSSSSRIVLLGSTKICLIFLELFFQNL